jgi:hypothetical protein
VSPLDVLAWALALVVFAAAVSIAVVFVVSAVASARKRWQR